MEQSRDTSSFVSQLFEDAKTNETSADNLPISFSDYLELVKQNPTIASGAHGRIYDMLAAPGFEVEDERFTAHFFDGEVFGLDMPLKKLVEYFNTAGRGHQTKRRILLLWGPPGGAKSSIATCIKRGLEHWTKTAAGAVYAIDGCPMHEEPLHLIPRLVGAGKDLRAAVQDYTGVVIDGELCPYCKLRIEEEFDGDFTKVPVRRIYFSEASRVGIGTFAPSDPKSMTVEQLTGGINFKQLEKYGADNDPRVLDWAGEFSKANRGVLECIEFLKNPKEFLVEFLTLSQERQFKVPKFGFIDADIVLLAHTNETEFRQKMADPTNEALQSRLYTITVPYNVRLAEEQEIYKKLLRQSGDNFHCDPHSIEAASAISILTRLEEHATLSLVEKMYLYDGKETGEFKINQVPEIRKLALREGLFGLDPRFVIDALSRAVSESEEGDLTTVMAMRALRTSIENAQQLSEEQRKHALGLLTEARKEIDRVLKDEVRKAFIPAFSDQAQELLENYLNNCEAWATSSKMHDEITGEELEPDEKLMRAIEEMIGVSDNAKEVFRNGVLARIGMWVRKGRPLTYNSDDQLGKGIEAYLFEELKDIIRITVSKKSPDSTHIERLNAVIEILCEWGYTEKTASALLDYVGALMNR